MSDIRKTFNFRAGVQVDDDVFIVRGSRVGIGTTVPDKIFDVRGESKFVGLVTAQNVDFSAGISTFGDVKIGSGISMNASSGIITGKFAGDVNYFRFLHPVLTAQAQGLRHLSWRPRGSSQEIIAQIDD